MDNNICTGWAKKSVIDVKMLVTENIQYRRIMLDHFYNFTKKSNFIGELKYDL